MKNNKYDLIIFDCDGTLVDTESIINTRYSEVLQGMGYAKYTKEYCTEKFASLGLVPMLEELEQDLGREFDRMKFTDALSKKSVFDPNKESIDSIRGAKELLSNLINNKACDICVASNGERPNVSNALKAAGLYEFFNDSSIFTYAQGTGIPKPAPDLFLYAAKSMGIMDPSKCLVIEDSDTGVKAANAANMDVIIIKTKKHQPRQLGIEKLSHLSVIHDLCKVLDYL